MISTRSVISMFFVLILWWLSQEYQLQLVLSSLSLLFQFPKQFHSMILRDNKVHNSASSLDFIDYYKICSSSRVLLSPLEFFTSVLADGLSLEFEWQQVSCKFPRLFSVFWSFPIMLSFGWSPLGRQLPSPSVPLIILLFLYQKHQSQFV